MTTFVHCRGCGVQIHETAPMCPKCGAPNAVTQTFASNTPSRLNQTNSNEQAKNLSKKWQQIFALIDKAGGAELPQKRSLTRVERNRIHANIWASLFTWLYYFVNGMWKKGIVLLIITFVGVGMAQALFEAIFGSSVRVQSKVSMLAQATVFIVMFLVVGRFANTDYFKKVTTGWNGWW